MKKLLLAVCCMLIVSSYSLGAVIFQDDLEGQALGDLADGTPAPIGTWNVSVLGDSSYVRISEDPATSGRGKVLEVKDIDAVATRAIASFASQTTSAITINFDFYVDGDVDDVPLLRVGPSWAIYNKWKRYYSDGGWAQNLGSAGTENVFRYYSDMWYNITMELKAPADGTGPGSVHYYIEDDAGNVVADVYASRNSDVSTYDYMSFRQVSDGDHSHVYVDNLVVTEVPEPATIGLVGLGLLGLARRRFAKI